MNTAKRLPKVVIVGKVNAGKSTLFNRLVRKPLAVTAATPGVTRDRLRKPVSWGGVTFELVDTGGLYPPHEDEIFERVVRHIEHEVKEADLVLFLVDLKEGLTPYDEEIGRWLRRTGRPVLLVANKADVKRKDPLEFLKLGFGEPLEISAEHNRGITHLLDTIVETLERQGTAPGPEETPSREDLIRVSILGKPNVGKSSLLNALVGREISVISEVPGTTRDAVDFVHEPFLFVDTAGLKRRYRDELEYFAAVRTERSLHFAEVVIVVLDITQPITRMDKRIIGLAVEEGKGVVIALNKADLLSSKERREKFPEVQRELDFVEWAPKLFTSAKTGEGLDYLKDVLVRVHQERKKRIPKRDLLAFWDEVLEQYTPPARVSRFAALHWEPPEFLIETVDRDMPGHFVRFLEKKLRERFGFWGVPIRWTLRRKRKRHP